MSDKIGVLGEASTTTVGTTTAYTCPTSKAAKFRIMMRMKGNAAGGTILDVFVNGMKIARVAAMTADYYTFTNNGAGLLAPEQAAEPTGLSASLTVTPADPIYYCSQGDTVQYAISGAAAAEMNFQVVGAEIDV